MIDIYQTINHALENLEYGTVNLTVKKHRGEVSAAETSRITNYRFLGEEKNTEAATAIITLIKKQTEAKCNGALSFTLIFKNGDSEQLQVQDFHKT